MLDPVQDTTDERQLFAEFLLRHRKSRLHDELSDGMRAVVAAVRDTGKSGAVKIKLTVKVQPGTDALVVTDETDFTIPEHDRGAAIYFATDDHDLVRKDPNQMAMRFTDTDDGNA